MNSKKQKLNVDRILYLLPILIICGFFIHVWWSNAPATKLAIGLTLSSVVFVATFGSLLTKEIGARGFWIVKKQEKPGLFWSEFAAQLLLALFILVYAFI